MNGLLTFFLLGISLLSPLAVVSAQETEGEKFERAVKELHVQSADPDLEHAVVQRLKNHFTVTDEQIAALRGRALEYGDIAAVYALADQMPGGITDDNMERILSLRTADNKRDWASIVLSLGLSAEQARVQVGKITASPLTSKNPPKPVE